MNRHQSLLKSEFILKIIERSMTIFFFFVNLVYQYYCDYFFSNSDN